VTVNDGRLSRAYAITYLGLDGIHIGPVHRWDGSWTGAQPSDRKRVAVCGKVLSSTIARAAGLVSMYQHVDYDHSLLVGLPRCAGCWREAMDLGIASAINTVHYEPAVSAQGMRRIAVLGPTVALVAASVATRIRVALAGTPVLVAYAPAGDTAKFLLARADAPYDIEVTNRSEYAADIYVTLEPTGGHPG
jgi:hypothetical protein